MMEEKIRGTAAKAVRGKSMKLGLALCMLVAVLLPGCGSESVSAQYKGVYISEVVSSNSDSLTDPQYGSPDWIELHNASDEAVSLENYSLYESNGNRYIFPAVTIEPGGYLVVYCCSSITDAAQAAASAAAAASEEASTEPTPEPTWDGGVICTGFKLSKDGTDLTLGYSGGTIQKLTIPALETDVSYGYRGDGTYGFFLQTTPGEANTTPSYATLEELRSGEQISLQITEILPKDVSKTEPYAWIELYNAGEKAIRLSDYYITENLSNMKKASLPDVELEAGKYVVLRFSNADDDSSIPFRIGDDETTIAISDTLGVVVSQITWDSHILPGISAGPGANNGTVYYTLPTPGAANSTKSFETTDLSLTEGRDAVYINELLYKNTFSVIDQYGERSPWVELYNGSTLAVSLSDYALSDDAESLWKWNLPDITLDPGGYVIVYLSGKDQKTGELQTSFKLGDADTALYLTNISTQTLQTVTLPVESKDNVSYGLSADGQWMFFPQPTPQAANTTQGFTEVSMVSGDTEGIIINEVSSVSAARSGDSDWVELYNGSSADVSLEGYYLSDSRDSTTKWPISDASIKAGGYKVIEKYVDGDTTETLSISLSGEKLYLFSPQGLLLDEFETGVLRPGISRGLYNEGTETKVVFFDDPTPGSANGSDVLTGYCAAPVFSVQGGYQSKAISLEITTATEGGAIHYTTDGSTPTESSSVYTGPISISGNKVVRAITIAEGKITSEQTVATYIFDDVHSLPVVCLSMTQSDLSYIFGSQNRSDTRERGGYVEYYESDGTLGVMFPAGMRIAGAGTRQAQQKSINLYLRGGYGRSSVTYPFFSGYDITTFKSLSLRNMGAWQDPTRMRDVFINMAANGLNVDNAQAKFAVVYINGQYWGLYELKENQNEEYFASKHDVDPDKVVMIRGNKYNVQTGRSDKDIVSLYASTQQNMNNADVFEDYTNLADSDYFMDYLIAEMFFDCEDTYNQKFAHTTDNSMKWRPIFYDFDLSMRNKSKDLFNTFFCDIYQRRATDSLGVSHDTYMYLYNGFIKNDTWKEQFIERYAEVLNNELSTDRLLTLFDSMVDSIDSEIPLTAARWPDPSSYSQWKKDVATMRGVIEARRAYCIKHLQNYFNLSDARIAELFPNG